MLGCSAAFRLNEQLFFHALNPRQQIWCPTVLNTLLFSCHEIMPSIIQYLSLGCVVLCKTLFYPMNLGKFFTSIFEKFADRQKENVVPSKKNPSSAQWWNLTPLQTPSTSSWYLWCFLFDIGDGTVVLFLSCGCSLHQILITTQQWCHSSGR